MFGLAILLGRVRSARHHCTPSLFVRRPKRSSFEGVSMLRCNIATYSLCARLTFSGKNHESA
jgi:hypothetical protein